MKLDYYSNIRAGTLNMGKYAMYSFPPITSLGSCRVVLNNALAQLTPCNVPKSLPPPRSLSWQAIKCSPCHQLQHFLDLVLSLSLLRFFQDIGSAEQVFIAG
jgi:hypothetical protein